ncbi:glycosyltransferase [Paroceanicella profunda]|nr:glycosyltransferase [Paroceanicella profunda]
MPKHVHAEPVHDALLKRAAQCASLEGPEAATRVLLDPFPESAPPEKLFRAAVRTCLNARKAAAALPLFERLASNPGLRRRMAALEIEALVKAEDMAGAEAFLARARLWTPPVAAVEQWGIALACAQEEPDAAIVLLYRHLDRFGDDVAALLPVLQQVRHKEPLTDALILRYGDSLTDPRVMIAFAWGMWNGGRPSEALYWVERVLAAGVARPPLYMLAARAAMASGDAAKARRMLSVGLMSILPEDLVGNSLLALQEILLSEDNLLEFQRELLASGEFSFSRELRSALQLTGGEMEGIIERYLRDSAAPGFEFNAREFIFFCGACIETSRYDLVRAELVRIPPEAELDTHHLIRILRMPTVEETPATRAFVINRLRALRMVDEDTPSSLILGLSLADSSADRATFAQRCAAFLDQGYPAHELRLFLAEHGASIAASVPDPAVAERLRVHSATAMDVLSDPTSLSFVNSERHLCEIMHQRMIEAGGDTPKVSILAPVHRAADLPNLRDCIARQTWPDLEAVVVANGPLCGDPAVEAAMSGLATVKVLHHHGRRVGEFLNTAADAAEGAYMVRFDADDIYYDNYVTTAIRTMQSSNADMAGKSAVFFYSETFNRIFLARHARYFADARQLGYYGTGSTQCFRREVFEKIRFIEHIDRGEDYLFYTNAIQTGWKVFNLDPFNHLIIRRTDRSAHTWHAGDRALFPGALHCLGGPQNINRLATLSVPTPPIRLAHICGLSPETLRPANLTSPAHSPPAEVPLPRQTGRPSA